MNVCVTEYEKKYTFELASVTQLCGQNIVKKTYIFESIRRYFSTYKYREEANKWRDNVKLDNENVGRKFFTVISIRNIADILDMIKWSKQSLMAEYVKQMMQRNDLQLHLRAIDEELEMMFQSMNVEINRLGEIELTYAVADVWDMVQKSSIVGSDEIVLEDKTNYELFLIFLNLIEEVMEVNPKKMLVLMENMDHFISRKEYQAILEKLKQIGRKYTVYFVLSTSIDGYVGCDKELCSGITVFGDVDFQMPEFEELYEYIKNNYPCNKILLEEQVCADLIKITQKIGQKEYLYDVEQSVICKLINQTLMLYEKWTNTEKIPEIAFLKA